MENVKKALENAQKEAEKQKRDRENLNEAIEDLSWTNQELTAEKEQLMEKFEQKNQQIATLQGKCFDLKNEQDNTDYARVQSMISEYKWQLEEKEGENAQLKREAIDKDAIINKQQREIDELKRCLAKK